MQEALNKIVNWGEKWGFKISVEKRKHIVFGNKKTECQGLFMYGQAIERVKEFKFLQRTKLGRFSLGARPCWGRREWGSRYGS